jgi:hypothetical protein
MSAVGALKDLVGYDDKVCLPACCNKKLAACRGDSQYITEETLNPERIKKLLDNVEMGSGKASILEKTEGMKFLLGVRDSFASVSACISVADPSRAAALWGPVTTCRHSVFFRRNCGAASNGRIDLESLQLQINLLASSAPCHEDTQTRGYTSLICR